MVGLVLLCFFMMVILLFYPFFFVGKSIFDVWANPVSRVANPFLSIASGTLFLFSLSLPARQQN